MGAQFIEFARNYPVIVLAWGAGEFKVSYLLTVHWMNGVIFNFTCSRTP